MKRLFRAAATVQQIFEGNGWRFCFIGGLALQRWGENRLTRDIDVSLLTGFENEDKYIGKLLERSAVFPAILFEDRSSHYAEGIAVSGCRYRPGHGRNKIRLKNGRSQRLLSG